MSKNYINTFCKQKSGQYGDFMSISMKLSDLQGLPVDKFGHVKVVVSQRREADKYGCTHYMYEDTYKPGDGNNNQQPSTNNQEINPPF